MAAVVFPASLKGSFLGQSKVGDRLAICEVRELRASKIGECIRLPATRSNVRIQAKSVEEVEAPTAQTEKRDRGWFYTNFVKDNTMEAKVRQMREASKATKGLVNTMFDNSFKYTSWIGAKRDVACQAQAGAMAAMSGTPVRTTSILVVGATGTLGRQIVRKALDEGYDVRCLVRPRQSPADFLRDWGATVVNGDLGRPETLPAALVGIHTIIDCATGRPEEPIRAVDWDGKVALIECAKAMGIQRFVFFSIHNCEKHPEVPLMEIKRCTEQFLQKSGLNYTTIRLCGFMQALIGQYAVPILEEKSVWGTDAATRIAYMDTQDVAKMTLACLRNEKLMGQTVTLAGPRAWTTQEVIALCERLAGQDAKVTTVPVGVLKATRLLTRFFQWTTDVADRLAFSEVLTSDTVFSAPMGDTYQVLGLDPKETTTLEIYLQEYYTQILRKLKDLKATSKQGDYYL